MSRPSAFRSRLLGAVLLLLLPAAAVAAPGDYEFAQRLAKKRYFDLARRVYQEVLADKNATEAAKAEARFGVAMLPQEQAIASTGQPGPYAGVAKRFEDAVASVEEFVQKNPSHPKVQDARLGVGTIRLAFVTWARDLLTDAAEMEERKTTPDEVREAARKAVTQAISYFDGLRPKGGAAENDLQQFAQYSWVMCQYYEALVLPACSAEAASAFQRAYGVLEEYIIENDGYLLAVYAQDIQGLVSWELAKCERDQEKQLKHYDDAVTWFKTCIDTDNLGPDYLKVITSGYYHLGQLAVEAGKPPGRNYWRTAADEISKMVQKHPTAWRTDSGIKALIELSKVECARGDAGAAVRVATEARDRAGQDGRTHLVQMANRQLSQVVSGGCGGSVGAASPIQVSDPSVLFSVAEDAFNQKRWPEAARAYRNVIASAPDTTQGLLQFQIPSWRKLSRCYREVGDLLAAALALEPIHHAWLDGRIPHKPDDENDVAMRETGNARREAMTAIQEVAEKTGSKAFRDRFAEMRDAFFKDYPKHPSGQAGIWNQAMDIWRHAQAMKKDGNPEWTRKIEEARKLLRLVAADMNAERQDEAWVYLVWSFDLERKWNEAVAVHQEATKFWASPEAKAQEEKFEAVRGRRRPAMGRAKVWAGQALQEGGRAKDAIVLLASFHEDHPGLDSPFPSLARQVLIESHLAEKDLEGADRHWRSLLRDDPNYDGLANIARLFAGFYNDQYREIETRLKEITGALGGKEGLTARLRRALKERETAINTLADLYAKLIRQEALRDAYEQNKEESGIVVGDYERTRDIEIPATKKRIAEAETARDKAAAEAEGLQKQVDDLTAERDRLTLDLFGPLTKAALYYLQWDDALKLTGQERTPSNVAALGAKFWRAARLKPDETEMWQRARLLYEDYLAFPKVKDLPPTDPDKRQAIARLGDCYANLAERETDATKRRDLVGLAVEFLQSSIANLAENNPLLVGVLSGDFVVLPWTNPANERAYRFPVRRVDTVAAFRAEVEALGRPGGTPIPKFATDPQNADYAEALAGFKRHVQRMEDRALGVTVESLAKAGPDWAFLREHGNTSPEFRLALASAYAESARPEDMPKAIVLAGSFTEGPIRLDEEADPETYWRANTLRLKTYLAAAEQAADGSATRSQWLTRAGQFLSSSAGGTPDVGDAALPGNRAAWRKMLERINALRTNASLPVVNVDLSGAAPPPGGEPGSRR